MFNIYDKVLIKSRDIIGTIVDIRETNMGKIITVESDRKGKVADAYGGIWPLIDCNEDELKRV